MLCAMAETATTRRRAKGIAVSTVALNSLPRAGLPGLGLLPACSRPATGRSSGWQVMRNQ